MKKKHLLIVILITLLIIPIITADLYCEISEDNITFTDIRNAKYGGDIDEINGIVTAQNLEPDGINYYIRCKENNNNWTYVSEKTNDVVKDEKMIASVIAMFIMIGFFLIMAIINKGIAMKILGFGVSILETTMLMVMIWVNEVGTYDISNLYKINAIIMVLLSFFMLMTTIIIISINGLGSDEKEKTKWEDLYN